MDDSARGDVEILVHTTAPSRGQDDTRYRALARAYLDFEPVNRRALDYESEIEDEDWQADSQLQEELLRSTQQEEPESQASYRPEDEHESVALSSASLQDSNSAPPDLSQEIYSPELSFNGVLDNAGSFEFRGRPTCSQMSPVYAPERRQTQDSVSSWQQPPSIVEDSQPGNDLIIGELSSPTRMLELYLQQIESSEDRSSGRRDGRASEGMSSQLRNEKQQSQSSQSKDTGPDPSSTSGEPSSPPPQKPPEAAPHRIVRNRKQNISYTQEPRILRKRKHPEPRPVAKPRASSVPVTGAVQSSLVASSVSTRSRKKQQIEITKSRNMTWQEEIPSSQAPPTMSISSSFKSSFASVMEIRPPPPPVSMSHLTPEMLVTESLRQLASKMPLSRLYRPQQQMRELRPMERGHWLIDCQGWKEELRGRHWDCLGNFIGKGQAGWGIWCVRDEEYKTVRVYCWGSLVGYIYLLLYMASESKIKGTGACWVGGDGQAIIRMPS